jgi:rhombotail lipoprotein
MIRRLEIATALLPVIIFAGCATHGYPGVGLQRGIFPDVGHASEAELQQLMSQPVTLSEPVSASILWLDESYGAPVAEVPEAERTRQLEQFTKHLAQPPFGRVSILPTTLERRGPGVLDLPQLRSAAARFQSDVLILLTTRANAYSDPNILAISYIALVPMLFVPGNDLAEYVSAEACSLDVRMGVFLGCAQGHGDASRSLVTLLGRDSVLRDLAARATASALLNIPSDLRATVGTRIGEQEHQSATLRPYGERYETP